MEILLWPFFFYEHYVHLHLPLLTVSLAGVERFHWIEVAEYCVFLLQFHCVLEGEFLLKLFSSLTCSFLSSEFCEAHLQLLFTILEKAPQATIRANTIVAVGDLTFRFPNLIEPWTSHLYARFVNGELQTYKVLESVLGVSKETHGSLWESNGQSISLPLSPFSLFLQQACRCTNTNLIKDIIDHVISFQRM